MVFFVVAEEAEDFVFVGCVRAEEVFVVLGHGGEFVGAQDDVDEVRGGEGLGFLLRDRHGEIVRGTTVNSSCVLSSQVVEVVESSMLS